MSNKKANNILETWGNESTMNLNAIIYQNILSSPYFRSLLHGPINSLSIGSNKKTFHEIVDEIYNEVNVLTPFVKGTQPSTAYCCLFKMWTLRLTVKQIENMIDHVDSPYIRAIGFLYLRYVCAPAKLWDWFQYYLEDEEEITISSGPKPTKITIGKLCHMLITEQKFQGTMLPRIPVPIARDLEGKLKEHELEKRGKSRGSVEEDRYRSRSRSSARRSRSRSPVRLDDFERRKSSSSSSRRRDRSVRDELDDYEYKSGRHDRNREDRHRRDRSRDELNDYRRHDRSRSPYNRSYRSRSRSRDRYHSDRHYSSDRRRRD